MEFYLVGGAVRDELLGLPVTERDWVVVGADREAMRAAGFAQADPVFPVFRHPETGEEYALARRETKRGSGYRGFQVDAGPDVTLHEDLQRRDLTVNAMARDAAGHLIDPFDGRADLDRGLLRHVSPAFVEDPLRVIRLARFAASLGRFGFRVAHGTQRLAVAVAQGGELAHLAPERLWREMHKAMGTEQPWRFFEVLHRCGALAHLVPSLAAAMGEVEAHGARVDSPPVAALKRIAACTGAPAARTAAALCTCVDGRSAADALLQGLRADRDTALLLRRCVTARGDCARARQGDAASLMRLLQAWRAFDAGHSFGQTVAVCAAQEAGNDLPRRLDAAAAAARRVDPAALAAQGLAGAELGQALRAAREQAIRDALGVPGSSG
jgi:tRNA nucleotidyltransferase (CCA-adding enzyme)